MRKKFPFVLGRRVGILTGKAWKDTSRGQLISDSAGCDWLSSIELRGVSLGVKVGRCSSVASFPFSSASLLRQEV